MPEVKRGGRPLIAPRQLLHGLLAFGPTHDLQMLATRMGGTEGNYKKLISKDGSLSRSRFVELGEDGYALGAGLGLVLAFSVGAERLTGALITAGGKARCVHTAAFAPRQLEGDPDDLLRRLGRLAVEVLTCALEPSENLTVPSADGRKVLRLIGASAAWPFPMDHTSQPVGGPVRPEWRERTLREHLRVAVGLPLDRCHATNDANAGALTLAFEQKEPRPGALMCVHLAAGIGLGTVHQAIPKHDRLAFVDAHLVGGQDNVAGEIGHVVVDGKVVDQLNAAIPKTGPMSEIGKLIENRPCTCGLNMLGHLEAVVGAEAVLERLRRYKRGDSQAQRLIELHADAERNPLVKHALADVGRAVAGVLSGAVAAADPVTLQLVGALASEHIAKAMNEQFRANNVADRAELYTGAEVELVGLRGAALAVLRGGVFRGFFERVGLPVGMRLEHVKHATDWTGWDKAPEGAQSGATSSQGSAWKYEPLEVDQAFIDRMPGSEA